MATHVLMPRLSDSMEEGTVVRWLVEVGATVRRDDPLAEIETDKATLTYEADSDGLMLELIASEGETLAVGAPIALIGKPGEQVGSSPGAPPAAEPVPAAESSPAAASARASEPVIADGSGDGAPRRRLLASPVARRVARELGVDLSGVSGSGPSGRIVRADIEAAAAASATPAARTETEGAKGEVRVVEPTRLQRTVARRMSESTATAPHFSVEAEVDMTHAVAARARLKASAQAGEAVPSFNDMVVKASALALRELPRANGAYRDGRFELYSRVNVGVAVAAEDALVVPTIFDADRKGLRAIAAESRALAGRVRDGTVTPAELSGGTFTVSNLGMYGISRFGAVINPPQAAILAVGAIAELPVVRDGAIEPGHVMGLTLVSDHRILYGADAARLLGRIRALLEEPLGLAL